MQYSCQVRSQLSFSSQGSGDCYRDGNTVMRYSLPYTLGFPTPKRVRGHGTL